MTTKDILAFINEPGISAEERALRKAGAHYPPRSKPRACIGQAAKPQQGQQGTPATPVKPAAK